MNALSTLARAFVLAAACLLPAWPQAPAVPELPQRLQDTGLFDKAGVVAFAPQYALWSDGAAKRRWLRLPPGAGIDASRVDEWRFPPGTQLWKEFAVDGRPVETRYVERLPGGEWRFAAYVWNAQGTEATLAPARGTALDVAGAPGGRYLVPSRGDCLACHGSAPVPVLGFSAVQVAPQLRSLVAQGVLKGLPQRWAEQPPQIAASTPAERAALGYLHANCAHCHNTGEQRVPLKLTLAQRALDPDASRAEVLRSTLLAMSRWRPAGAHEAHVIVPGRFDAGVLALRMRSRHPQVQMPPLGTQVPDTEGLALLARWVDHDLTPPKEKP